MSRARSKRLSLTRELPLVLGADGLLRSRDDPQLTFDPATYALLHGALTEESLDDWIRDSFDDPGSARAVVADWIRDGLVAAGADRVDAQPGRADAQPDDARATWPIFAVGCHRSGTTLVRHLLDAHPRIACPGESKFIAALAQVLDYPQASSGIVGLGCSVADVHRGFRDLICRLMGKYAARCGKARWADKTPNYYRILEFIDSVFQHGALYVFILRHPLDVIDSLRSWRHLGDPELQRAFARHGDNLHGRARYWVEVNETLHAFYRLHRARCFALRYEDLVHAPQDRAAELMSFLGEECPDDLVARAFELPHTPGFGDDKIRATTRVETGSVGKWRRWPRDHQLALAHIVNPTAELWGYEPVA